MPGDDRLEQLRERTRYAPAEAEPGVFERWEQARIFHPEPEGDASENFSIAITPPNVTGVLHMGHALNGSIQDALIRLRRMLQCTHRRRAFGGVFLDQLAQLVQMQCAPAR